MRPLAEVDASPIEITPPVTSMFEPTCTQPLDVVVASGSCKDTTPEFAARFAPIFAIPATEGAASERLITPLVTLMFEPTLAIPRTEFVA